MRDAAAATRDRGWVGFWAATITTALLLAGGVCGAGSAYAASATLAWDPNPPAEQVKVYRILDGDAVIWEGTATQATVELAPGAHTITAVSCTEATNPDGTKVPLCSGKSEAVDSPVSSNPRGVHVTVITVRTE